MRTHVTILNVHGSDSAGEVIPYPYFFMNKRNCFPLVFKPNAGILVSYLSDVLTILSL